MYSLVETLHRLVKLDIDGGHAATVEEAQARFAHYRVAVSISDDAARNPIHQATLLTIVNIGRRCFLGGVEVSGCLEAPLLCHLPYGPALADAVIQLGGTVVTKPDLTLPRICLGFVNEESATPFAITPTFQGWRGGIVPANSNFRLNEEWGVMPVSVLVAALAVNETFAYLRGDQPDAGSRVVGLSLWRPDAETDWSDSSSDGPSLEILPTKLWITGLGHLGQAYLWMLALLPYADPHAVELVLQDVDQISPSTESTSILTSGAVIGQRKTRAVASWLESRGFRTFLHERLFDSKICRQSHEPQILLCGIDNVLGRQCLEDAGFGFVVEAGLGSGVSDFRAIRLHTFPGRRRARDIWQTRVPSNSVTLDLPAYQSLAKNGIDQCGLTLLANKAVGAPFVGGVTASLVVAEILRLLAGGPIYSVIDIDLRALRFRTAVLNLHDFSLLNPGFTHATTK